MSGKHYRKRFFFLPPDMVYKCKRHQWQYEPDKYFINPDVNDEAIKSQTMIITSISLLRKFIHL